MYVYMYIHKLEETRESIEVRESTRIVLGDIPQTCSFRIVSGVGLGYTP